MELLETTAELFPFKSKGILIGTSSYEALQRNRFELAFEDPASEGILDGGHNMLAIGLHMLSAVAGEKEIAHVRDIAGAYRLVLDMARFAPQKLAKNQASHEFAVGEFEKALLKHRAMKGAA